MENMYFTEAEAQPRETAFIAAMVLDTSINVMRRGKPVADQFSRSEYETLVRVLQPESRS